MKAQDAARLSVRQIENLLGRAMRQIRQDAGDGKTSTIFYLYPEYTRKDYTPLISKLEEAGYKVKFEHIDDPRDEDYSQLVISWKGHAAAEKAESGRRGNIMQVSQAVVEAAVPGMVEKNPRIRPSNVYKYRDDSTLKWYGLFDTSGKELLPTAFIGVWEDRVRPSDNVPEVFAAILISSGGGAGIELLKAVFDRYNEMDGRTVQRMSFTVDPDATTSLFAYYYKMLGDKWGFYPVGNDSWKSINFVRYFSTGASKK